MGRDRSRTGGSADGVSRSTNPSKVYIVNVVRGAKMDAVIGDKEQAVRGYVVGSCS